MTAPRCPYCLDDLLPDRDPVRCTKCRTPHHQQCFEENGGCAAYGCQNREEVPAGVSLFRVPQLTLHHRMTAERAFGPFVLGWKRLPPLPERRPPARCPSAYVRLSLEGRELREGGVLRGRGVIYTPEPLRFSRIDVSLSQGLSRPQALDRVTIAEPKAPAFPSGDLGPGSHPFHLELQAPAATGPVDPFTIELLVGRGLLSADLRSLPHVVFLLETAPEPTEALRAPRVAIRVNAREEGAPEREARVVPPRDRGLPNPFESDRPHTHAAGDGWLDVPVEVAGRGDPDLLGPGGPSSVRARYVRSAYSGSHMAVTSPTILAAPELPLQIAGGGRLSSLTLALRYELVRPGGGEVTAPGFPALEEVRVLGSRALDANRYGPDGIDLQARIGAGRLAALSMARAGGAHNAALRIRVGIDAIDVTGRVLPPMTRTATYTGT